MKKLLLSILAIGSFAAAEAQPGSILAFGNVGITTVKNTDKSNDVNWNVNPGIGYQFDKHWTVGLVGGYASQGSKPENGKWSSTKDWNIGAFGRYTMPLGSIFAVYGQLEAGYQNEHSSFDGKKVDNSNLNGFYAAFAPAIGVNVYKGFALNFGFGGLGFNTLKSEVSGSNAQSTFNLTFGQQVNIGISKNFGCGHKMKGHHEPMDDTRHMNTSDDEDSSPKKKKASKDDDE